MRRDDISIYVSPLNRARLEAIIADRNSASKAVWRAEIVLATAEGLGTNAIMKRTGKSKPCVWRAAHLGRGRLEAAPRAPVQDIERPVVRGESDRCRRALHEPAGPGAGAAYCCGID
jgi:hypothetical protein